MRQIPILVIATWVIAAGLADAAQETKTAAKAEYPLTPKCGPWMVMVKSFQGPEAVLYANQLASELREKHKIVAYAYVKQPEQSQVQQVGYVRGRIRQYPSAAVLAGDCKNEKAAAKLQDQIQKLRPASITEDMVPKYQWQAGPLRTAFCLPNPLNKVPNEPDAKSQVVLQKINMGKNSIFNCAGEYTLEAALFTGGIAYTDAQAKNFEKHSLLEAAGEHAEQVCTFLRGKGYDAYTYHALTYSVVAVGSFGSPNDPQIEPLRKQIAGMNVASTNLMLSANPAIMKVPHKGK